MGSEMRSNPPVCAVIEIWHEISFSHMQTCVSACACVWLMELRQGVVQYVTIISCSDIRAVPEVRVELPYL